jgi:hypothetical protein
MQDDLNKEENNTFNVTFLCSLRNCALTPRVFFAKVRSSVDGWGTMLETGKVEGSSPDDVIEFLSISLIFPGALRPWGLISL